MASRRNSPQPVRRCLRSKAARLRHLGVRWRNSSSLVTWILMVMLALKRAIGMNVVEIWTEWDLNNYLSLHQGGSQTYHNTRFVFRERAAFYRLSASFRVSGALKLDASRLPDGLTIQAARNSSHFSILPDGNLTTINLKFKGAYVTSTAAVTGGSMRIEGSLTTFNSTFENNTVISFAAEASGGAISVHSGAGTVRLFNTTFIENKAISRNAAAYGGAVYALGDVYIDDCVFEANQAVGIPTLLVSSPYLTGGGAIYKLGGRLIMLRSHILGNVGKAAELTATSNPSAAAGGAIAIWGAISCQFNSTTFSNNLLAFNAVGTTSTTSMSLYGGALSANGTSCVFSGVVMSNNLVTDYYALTAGGIAQGGAMVLTSSSPTTMRNVWLINCEFVGNRIAMRGTGIGGAVAVLNQLRLVVSEGTSFLSNAINITAGTARGFAHGGGLYASVLSLNSRDVRVEGNTVTCISSTVEVNAYGAGIYAGGEYSSGPRIFVSTAFIRNKGSVVIRSVAGSCSANGGGLNVLSGTGSTLNISSSTFIANSVSIRGGSSITGHRAFGGAIGASGIFGPWATKIADSTFIENSANSTTAAYGGAIFCNLHTSFTCENCNFTSNRATLTGVRTSGRADGAAVYGKASVVEFKSCWISNNVASNIGGVGATSIGALCLEAVTKATLDTCRFVNNRANNSASAGALYAIGGSAANPLVVKRCTFTGSSVVDIALVNAWTVSCRETTGSVSFNGAGTLPMCYPSNTTTTVMTSVPTRAPTTRPTRPTIQPTIRPSTLPTVQPSRAPTQIPSAPITQAPTISPTTNPTVNPTTNPTLQATLLPSTQLTKAPTIDVTSNPTINPTGNPTLQPTLLPSTLPTEGPSLVPSKAPTQLPTHLPTLPEIIQPTITVIGSPSAPVQPNVTYTIQIRSAYHLQEGQIVVNKQDLSLQVSPSIVRRDGAAVWRSDSSSLLRPTGDGGGLLTPSVGTSFLAIGGAALVEGGTYVISVSAKGSWIDQQVVLMVNEAPRGGSLFISPVTGQALATTFTATCAAWTDSDLPLAYLYTAQLPGLPHATLLPLAGPTNQSVLQTALPSSTDLTFRVNIVDALGASTLATRTSITVTRLGNVSQALSILSALELEMDTSIPLSLPIKLDNSSATRLVSTLGVVTRALTELPEPVAPAVESRILQLLNASLEAMTLDLSRAEALGGVLQALSTQEFVDTPPHDLLELTAMLTDQVEEQVGSISTSLTASILDALDGVIRFRNALAPVTERADHESSTAAVINTTSAVACAAVRQSSNRMDKILESVHALISTDLVPGQSAVEHATPSLVLVSQAQTIETMVEDGGLRLGSPMESGLKFQLGVAALQAVSRLELLPNQTLTVKKVDWSRTRRPCAVTTSIAAEASSAVSNYSVSTTSIGQIDLIIPGSKSAIKLSSLNPPLQISTPHAATVAVSVSCGQSKRGTKEVRCPGYNSDVVSVECDGNAETVMAVCPAPMPQCVFWNETEKAWSKKGVTTRGVEDGRLVCESTHASEFAVLSYATEQLWILSVMLRNPEWLQKDRSVVVTVAILYCIFIAVMLAGQRRRRIDDKYFVDSVKYRQFYEDAAACLCNLQGEHLPDGVLGTGDHFHHQRTLTRRLDSVVTDLTSRRIAVLQMEQAQGYKRGQVSSEVLGMSMRAHLGLPWHQKRLWIFLRGLTIIFLCTLLHGSGSNSFISAVLNEGSLSVKLVMEQFSAAFQRALIAFPLSLFIRGLTRTINRKSFEDRQLEEELNLPFYVPSPEEALGQEAYFCALRVAIKQLDLAKRALAYDVRIKAQTFQQQVDPKQMRTLINAHVAIQQLKSRYRAELTQAYREKSACGCLVGCVIRQLPIEVTGRLAYMQSLDMERVIEADYDRWVTEHLRGLGFLGPLLSWYYRSWIASPDLGGPGSSDIPWGYLLSYTCLVVYTLVLTLSTTLLSLGYSSRDGLAVLFGCLFTLCTDTVTMSALYFLIRLIGISVKHQLVDHIFSFQRPFLEHATGLRDAVTGMRLSGIEDRIASRSGRAGGQRIKVHVLASKGTRKAKRGEDTDDGVDDTDGPTPSASFQSTAAMTQPARPALGGKGTSYKLTDYDEDEQNDEDERTGGTRRTQTNEAAQRTRTRAHDRDDEDSQGGQLARMSPRTGKGEAEELQQSRKKSGRTLRRKDEGASGMDMRRSKRVDGERYAEGGTGKESLRSSKRHSAPHSTLREGQDASVTEEGLLQLGIQTFEEDADGEIADLTLLTLTSSSLHQSRNKGRMRRSLGNQEADSEEGQGGGVERQRHGASSSIAMPAEPRRSNKRPSAGPSGLSQSSRAGI